MASTSLKPLLSASYNQQLSLKPLLSASYNQQLLPAPSAPNSNIVCQDGVQCTTVYSLCSQSAAEAPHGRQKH